MAMNSETASQKEIANAAVKEYPFLDGDSPDANVDAIDMVNIKKERHRKNGMTASEALKQAILDTVPMFIKSPTQPQPAPPKRDIADDVAATLIVKKPSSQVKVDEKVMGTLDDGWARGARP